METHRFGRRQWIIGVCVEPGAVAPEHVTEHKLAFAYCHVAVHAACCYGEQTAYGNKSGTHVDSGSALSTMAVAATMTGFGDDRQYPSFVQAAKPLRNQPISAFASHSAQASISNLYSHSGRLIALACGKASLLRSANQRNDCALEPSPVTCMSGWPSRPWGIAEASASNATAVNSTSATWTRLKRQRTCDNSPRSRQSKANSQATTTSSAPQEKVENPKPSSSQSRKRRRVRRVRESAKAIANITMSSPQYNTAGPTGGPNVASNQRSAGSCISSVTFAADRPSATKGVRTNVPICASSRKRTS